MTEYVTIQVPKGLAEKVDRIISDKSTGFRSRSEFCIHAIRKEVSKWDAWFSEDLTDVEKLKELTKQGLIDTEVLLRQLTILRNKIQEIIAELERNEQEEETVHNGGG